MQLLVNCNYRTRGMQLLPTHIIIVTNIRGTEFSYQNFVDLIRMLMRRFCLALFEPIADMCCFIIMNRIEGIHTWSWSSYLQLVPESWNIERRKTVIWMAINKYNIHILDYTVTYAHAREKFRNKKWKRSSLH